MTSSSVENDGKSRHDERLSSSSSTTPRSNDEDHPVQEAPHEDNGTEHHENVDVVVVQERTTYQHRRDNENDDAPTTTSLWKIHEVWHSDGSYQQTQRRIEEQDEVIPDLFPVAQATPLPEATAELASQENNGSSIHHHRHPQDSGALDTFSHGSDQNTVASLAPGRMNTFHVVQVDEEEEAAISEGDGSIHSQQGIATTRVHVDEEVAPLPPDRQLRCCCIKTTERRLRHPCCLCSLALLTIFLIILMIVLIGYGVWAGTDKD